MSEIIRLQGQMEISAVADDRAWIACALANFEQPLVRYAQMFVGNAETARDIVQESFLKLCQQKQPIEQDQVKPWLFRVCRNGAIDFCRKEKRMATGDFDVAEVIGNRESEPRQQLEQSETISSVNQQIDLLPFNQQEVLRLKFQSGFSYQQIAEVTGLTKSNVGVLLHTALAKLKSKLKLANQ